MKKILILLTLFSALLAMGEIPKDGKTRYDSGRIAFDTDENVYAEAQAFSAEETGLKLLSGVAIVREDSDIWQGVHKIVISSVNLKFKRINPALELDNIDFVIRFYDAEGQTIGDIYHKVQPVFNNDIFNLFNSVPYAVDKDNLKSPRSIKVGIKQYALKGTAVTENHEHDAVWSFNPVAFLSLWLDFMARDMLTLSKENAAYWQDFDTEKIGLRLVGARVKKSNGPSKVIDYGGTLDWHSGCYIELDLERQDPQLEFKYIEYLVTLYDEIGNACGEITVSDHHPVFNADLSTPTSGNKPYLMKEPHNLKVKIKKYITTDGSEVSF
jgi:hypothetical protein